MNEQLLHIYLTNDDTSLLNPLITLYNIVLIKLDLHKIKEAE